ILLDVLDDVRRRHRIDPDRTYVVGAAEGTHPTALLAGGLPEYVGGLVVVGGEAEVPRLPYLRARAAGRLSLAAVAPGPGSDFTAALWAEHGVRVRSWAAPLRGQPAPAALGE